MINLGFNDVYRHFYEDKEGFPFPYLYILGLYDTEPSLSGLIKLMVSSKNNGSNISSK